MHDVIIIGAGVAGIYQLYKLRELDFDAVVLEAGDAPGGTWYWNRYPGARFDSESYTYGYSFSKELLQEWDWSEHFAAQPETLEYLNYVVDKFDLRKHMQFGCRVEGAEFDEAGGFWTVNLEDGRRLSARFLLPATGMLSAATLPRFPGKDSLEGPSFHTYHWPHEGIDLEGKRVAVFGTGATGVQVISEINNKVAELYVFQRHPNWCAPLHNGPIDDETQAEIKASYDDIFARCAATPTGFIHASHPKPFQEVSEEERLAFWEQLYASPGFAKWVGNFTEVAMDEAANAEYTKFIEGKIRARVHDPAIAEKLIPRDHGFGTRRVPLETRYYEAYNRSNVHLVDLNEEPVERITPQGVQTEKAAYEVDVIIYATGFDAVTGAFDRMDFKGVQGRTLREKWADGPLTYLGVQMAGFPNLIAVTGPQGGSVSANIPRGIEVSVDWITDLLQYLRNNGYERIEAKPEAEEAWLAHVHELSHLSLLARTKSWFTGYNSNLDRDDKPRIMIYTGGLQLYRERIREVAQNGYEGFTLS